jgi:uncharacterized membrane protein
MQRIITTERIVFGGIMNFQVRGCVGYILLFNIFIISAIFGTSVGWVGWVMPSLLIAVGFMFIQMLIDVALLLMGVRDVGQFPPEASNE